MKKNNPDTPDFFHIGDVLRQSMQSFRREADTDMARIWNCWNAAVGEMIAENAQPAAFKGTVLIVHVTSSTWIQHLRFLEKDIITRINRSFEKDVVKTIKFKIGAF